MRSLRTLLCAGVVTLCAVAGLPAAASAADGPYTALVISRDNHFPLGFELEGALDQSNDQLQVESSLGEGDVLSLTTHYRDGDLHYWSAVRVAPPAGTVWQQGQTYSATSGGGTSARLDLEASGRTCDGTGTVTVKQISRDAAQRLTAFAAAYEFHSTGKPGTVDGEIRWNSPLAYQSVLQAAFLEFGQAEIGAPLVRAARFTSEGTAPVTFGVARIEGTDASTFRVVDNQCAGRTFAAGEECVVLVEAATTSTVERKARLLLADDTSYGTRRTELTVDGYHNVVGTYYPLEPGRIMDTRYGFPSLPQAPIGPGGEVDLQVGGRAGVPATGVSAVVLNVTVTQPTADSFVTVYPSGEARPTASSVNFAKGWLGSNNVTVKLSGNGKVKIYNRNGSTHVVVDVVGFYAGTDAIRSVAGNGGQLHPVKPTRLIDTRTTGSPLPAGTTRRFFVDFGPELSNRNDALVLNITVVAPEKSGFLTAWSGSTAVPSASTVNYGAGKVVPNLAIVQSTFRCDCGAGHDVPTFALHSSQRAHVVVDLVGVLASAELVPNGLRFTPVSPTRIVDSRIGLGTSGVLGPQVTRTVTAPPALVTDATRALAMNVTAVAPTQSTVLTVWPADAGLSKPTASNLNPAAGQTVSNAVFSGIGPADAFHVHNLAGSTHLVTDVVGRFDLYPYTVGPGGEFTVVRSGPAIG
ncbi:hypothetical protein GA0074695_0520 [Micromonospora viridifaciens]|uniref:Uncharacterized protein n=1 Tax=Micromonospora viridifaciens TaxID=1881 RepID=A0A1C4UIF9_MICVI|nr:hypothetical protein [Micromonospora viridifaciens]SCE71464.1 hypothetical protein GA0074695_0520 [Micromonospora viridifaciens]